MASAKDYQYSGFNYIIIAVVVVVVWSPVGLGLEVLLLQPPAY